MNSPLHSPILWVSFILCTGAVLYSFSPQITGFITKEHTYTNENTIVVLASKSQLWEPASKGELLSFSIDGEVSNQGSAKVWLESNGIRRLVFDSTILGNPSSQRKGLLQQITGNLGGTEETAAQGGVAVLHEESQTQGVDSINPSPESLSLELSYGNNPAYDTNNDGDEALNGVIDFEVSSSTKGVDQSKLCAKWTITNEDGPSSTLLCRGSKDCCAFLDLASSDESWDAPYYSTYNHNEETKNNIISSQLVYYDVDLSPERPYSHIVYSDIQGLSASFSESTTSFESECIETCVLEGFEKGPYHLVFELGEGTTLNISSINYKLSREVQELPTLLNELPNLTVAPDSSVVIDLLQYFNDANGDMNYAYHPAANFVMTFEGDTATITPAFGFKGTFFTYITASDGGDSVSSNIFRVDVAEPTNQQNVPVVVGKSVVWTSEIPLSEIKGGAFSLEIPEIALNVSVNIVSNNHVEEIPQESITVLDNNEEKSAKEFKDERLIKSAEREVAILQEGIKSGAGMIMLEGMNVSNSNLKRSLREISAEKEELENKLSSPLSLTAEDANDVATVVVENINTNDPSIDAIQVEYVTESPILIQSETAPGVQEVLISSEMHYTNVLAGVDIPESPQKAITLYWVQNGTRAEFANVTYLDTNLNGQIDRLEWVVPHLSNQTFEISITVLNVQSYPIVGGNWEVRFQTTGTANLTITGVNDTTYSEMAQDNGSTYDDLLPKTLSCGNSTLYDFNAGYMNESVWFLTQDSQQVKLIDFIGMQTPITSLFVENFNCDNQTAYWTSHVITPGRHHQRFTFGGLTAEAHNLAVSSCTNFTQGNTQYDLDTQIYQDFSSTCFKLNYTNITLDGHGINITTSVAGATVVNITSNGSTVRSLNLTSPSVVGSVKIEGGTAQDNLYNTLITNSTIDSVGTSSNAILFRSFNYNTTIVGNTLTNLYSASTTDVAGFTGTTLHALIANNSIESGVASGGNVGTCIRFSSGFHANNTISYNNCSSYSNQVRINGFLMTTSGQGNVFSHNNINLSTGGTYPNQFYMGLFLSGVDGGTYIGNLTISHNKIHSNNGGNFHTSFRLTFVSGIGNGVNVFNNLVSASGGSSNTPLSALSTQEVRNVRFWNNTWYTKNIGVYLNGTGSTAAARIDTNLTFINDTIAACPDNNACGSGNITTILLTENVTNVYMQDVRFNKTQIRVVSRDPGDQSAEKNNITVQWTLNLNVTDSSNGNALTTALIQINNSKGMVLYNGTVNSLGAINSTLITEFTQNGTVVPFHGSCTEQTDEAEDATANFSCFMPLNISVTATGYASAGFSFYLNQTNSTTVALTSDSSPPIVNTSFNATAFYAGTVVNYSANITDDMSIISATWSHNVSGYYVFINYSITGTSAQVSNSTPIISAGVFNFTVSATDAYGNRNSNSTLIIASDSTSPLISTGFNASVFIVGTVVNFSAVITEDTQLASANITYNLSSGRVYANYTLSGTSATIYNITTLTGTYGDVINFTAYATDTSNNVGKSSTLVFVGEATPPTVNTSFNTSLFIVGTVLNYSANITDDTSLSSAQWIHNVSGYYQFANYTISGTEAQVSNSTTLTSGGVFNFTILAIDTTGNQRQNATIITVTDVTLPIVNTSFNTSTFTTGTVLNYTSNITDETQLAIARWIHNLSGYYQFANYTISGREARVSNVTVLVSGGTFNFTIITIDSSGNQQQNDTLITVIDITPPIVNTSFNLSSPRIGTVLNYSANITDETSLSNATFVHNLSGYYEYWNHTLSGTSAQVSNITSITAAGTFNFSISVRDTSGNERTNMTIVTVPINIPITTLNYPADLNITNVTTVFNCSATDDVSLANVTLYGNWSGWHANETINLTGTSNSTTFAKNLSKGTYKWNCYACDGDNNCTFSSANYTFTTYRTYYLSNSSVLCSDSYTGNYSNPWCTFSKAYSVMQPGDTLIVMNGTYYSTSPPMNKKGTEENPLTFMAEFDGRAILNGGTDFLGNSYMEFTGFKFNNTISAINIQSNGTVNNSDGTSHHLTFKRVAIQCNILATDSSCVALSDGTHNVLFEDFWVWGGGRYTAYCYGGPGGNQENLNCYDNTFRRGILRQGPTESGGGNPQASLTMYYGSNNTIENVIALDSIPRSQSSNAIFYITAHSEVLAPTSTSPPPGSTGNRFYGIISLNTLGSAFYLDCGDAMCENNSLENSVLWDTSGPGITGSSQYEGASCNNTLADHNTVAFAGNETNAADGFSPYQCYNLTLTNNAFYFNTQYGIRYSGGSSLTNNSYNGYYNNTAGARSGYSPGLGDITTQDPGFRYITRIEGNSPYKNAGSSGDIGANILYQYENGVLTSTSLWPWPYEDRIRNDMCNISVTDPPHNWCNSTMSLTKYIWEYLGHPNPYKQEGELDFIVNNLSVVVSSTSANVSFRTNLLTNASVEIMGQILNDTTLNYSQVHFINISGLSAGTTYGYNLSYYYNGTLSNRTTDLWFTTSNPIPSAILNAPNDYNVTSNTTTTTFNCSATDDSNLANITLYGNWSGWHANETINLTGTSNSTTFAKNISKGAYKWNCYACDSDNNCAFSSANYTFTNYRIYYLSPNGSDANLGNESLPWKTFSKAFGTMASGDELVLLDGNYSETNGTGYISYLGTNSAQAPSGNSTERMTVIRANTMGNVVINGTLFVGRSNRKDQFIKFDGIIFEGGGSLYNTNHVIVSNSGFMATSSVRGGLNIGTNDLGLTIINTNDLIEDSWIVGRDRIIASTYNSYNTVWRRIIIRGDGCDDASCQGSGNPNVGITTYSSSNVSLQNVIVLDRVLVGSDISPYADFACAQHAGSGDRWGGNEWLGTISLKAPDSGYYCEPDAVWTTPAGTYKNCVSWDAPNGINVARAGQYNISNCVMMNTIGSGDAIRVAPELSGNGGTLKNSISIGSGRYGINSAYPSSYMLVNGTWSQGKYNQETCTTGCKTANPLSDGAVPSIRYITRIEDGSALKGAGDNGEDIGANIVNKYGTTGTFFGELGYNILTSNSLWPWPNEEIIKQQMCDEAYLTAIGRTGSDAPGLCASNQTLTKYIWEYLGHPNPYKQSGEVDFILSNLTVAASSSTANISFITNLLTNASVEINGQVINDTIYTTSKNHFINLSGLSASTIYEYNLSYRYNGTLSNRTIGLSFTTSSAPDMTPPIINATYNTSIFTTGTAVNYSANITDDTSLTTARWITNASGVYTYTNYSISGTSAQVSNSTNLPSGGVFNFTILAIDSSGNTNQNTTLITVADTTPPIANTSLNASIFYAGTVVNFSANITDETELTLANWSHNISGTFTFATYTLFGTSAQVSNTTTFTFGGVFNFSITGVDSSGNRNQNSTIVTVTDNVVPIINTSFNISVSQLANSHLLNFSANITDETQLSSVTITNNMSGTLAASTISISGTSAKVSNLTLISASAGTIINFSMTATDVSGNSKQNSTLITVTDTTPPTITLNLPPNAPTYGVSTFIPNITVSSDTAECLYEVNQSGTNISMSLSSTICLGSSTSFKNGNHNITFFVNDTSGNAARLIFFLNLSDTTNPTNPNGTYATVGSISSSGATVALSGINESVNATVYYGSSTSSLDTLGGQESDFSPAQIISLSSLSASITYYLNITVCDYNGNCATNDSVSFSTSAASSGDSGGGSGGGGSGGGGGVAAPVANPNVREKVWFTLGSGDDSSWFISDFPLLSILVHPIIDAQNPSLKVEKLNSKPSEIAPAEHAITYFEFTHSDNLQISYAKITFTVDAIYADQDIVLSRYARGWSDLPTEKRGCGETSCTFIATTPGFSYFAIRSIEEGMAKEAPQEQKPEPYIEQPAEIKEVISKQPTIEPPSEKNRRIAKKTWGVFALSIILLAVLTFLGVHLRNLKAPPSAINHPSLQPIGKIPPTAALPSVQEFFRAHSLRIPPRKLKNILIQGGWQRNIVEQQYALFIHSINYRDTFTIPNKAPSRPLASRIHTGREKKPLAKPALKKRHNNN